MSPKLTPQLVREFTDGDVTRYAFSIRKPKDKATKVFEWLLIDTGLPFLRAWFIMLILGWVHSAYAPVPPLVFWPVYGLMWVVSLFLDPVVSGGIRVAIQRDL